MNTTTRHPSVTPFRRSFACSWAACLILLATLSFLLSSSGTAQIANPGPLLQRVVISTPANFVTVTGQGFTPGGAVYIVVHDQWGEGLYPTVWTVASDATYGRFSSQDPAHGYIQAGSIHEQIALSSESIYGPNGSQDPAQGYVVGNPAPVLGSGIDLVVHAYDAHTRTWSNLVVAEVGTLSAVEIAPAPTADPALAPSCQAGVLCELP